MALTRGSCSTADKEQRTRRTEPGEGEQVGEIELRPPEVGCVPQKVGAQMYLTF